MAIQAHVFRLTAEAEETVTLTWQHGSRGLDVSGQLTQGTCTSV